jgi:hypothetical protein
MSPAAQISMTFEHGPVDGGRDRDPTRLGGLRSQLLQLSVALVDFDALPDRNRRFFGEARRDEGRQVRLATVAHGWGRTNARIGPKNVVVHVI